jgi:hypothetical protein
MCKQLRDLQTRKTTIVNVEIRDSPQFYSGGCFGQQADIERASEHTG